MQNDYDEPNNGDRYYYVDENKIRDQDTTTSSSTQSVDVRDHINYD